MALCFIAHNGHGTACAPDARGIVTVTADFVIDYVAPMPVLGLDSSSFPSTGPEPGESAVQELVGMARYDPAVVRAKALARRSAFTPQKAFIYSDWDFEISQVFKNVSSELIQSGSVITVTRPSGRLVQGGVAYVALDKTFPDFEEGG